jgi:hypothetical protein
MIRPCTVFLGKRHTPGADFFPEIAPRKIEARGILKLGGGRWGTVIQECIIGVQEKVGQRIRGDLRPKVGRTAGVIVTNGVSRLQTKKQYWYFTD